MANASDSSGRENARICLFCSPFDECVRPVEARRERLKCTAHFRKTQGILQ